LNKVPDATRQLERAVQLQPREPLARLQLARAYQVSENFLGLVDQYLALRESSSQEPEYAYQLGNAYMKLAVWCHQEIRRINPHSGRVYQTLGENFRLQGRTDQAIRSFQRAAQIDPNLAGIHLALAEIYLEQGKGDEADRELQQELNIVPDSAAALALKQKTGVAQPGRTQ
jgi:tetratricopeptide (TPR) repeat protein